MPERLGGNQMNDEAQALQKPGSAGSRLKALLRSSEIDSRMLTMVMVLIVLWLGLHMITDGLFLSARNLYNLAVQSSVVSIMATGMFGVIVSRWTEG